MLYFRVKFEANNAPMFLGNHRGIEMWSNYAGGELFTETEVRDNNLDFDLLIPVNIKKNKIRMMGPYRVPTDDASITPWHNTVNQHNNRFRANPELTVIRGGGYTKKFKTLHGRPVMCYNVGQTNCGRATQERVG